MTEVTAALRSEFAPTGTLRVGLNMSNFLLTRTDAATGKPLGVAHDLGQELARRLGLPVAFVPHPNPGALADAANKNVWDVGFLGAEPQRANEIDFTAAYVEIESTYLVPPGSPLTSIEKVDAKGVRIAVSARSAYDLYLTRTLKNGELVRAPGLAAACDLFLNEKLDALAGLRPALVEDAKKLPGSTILPGQFTAVEQAIGTSPANTAGAAFLHAFIEDAKRSGLVARFIAEHGVTGRLSVAPSV